MHAEAIPKVSKPSRLSPLRQWSNWQEDIEGLRTLEPTTIFAIAWLLQPIFLLILWLRARGAKNRADKRITEAEATADSLKKKYSPFTSVEDEVAKLGDTATEIQQQIEQMRSSYSETRTTLKRLGSGCIDFCGAA